MKITTSFLPTNARPVTDTFICDIDSETAFEWLKKNENNRNLKLAQAKKIAKSIQLNQWKCNHQPIAFDWNNKLIDGQHRLWAILKSNKTVSVRVTVNCEPESIKTVDTGTSRSNGDMLLLGGHKNASKKAATMKQYLCHKLYPDLLWNSSETSFTAITIEEALRQVEEKWDLEQIIKFTKSCTHSNKKLIHTSATTFYLLALDAGFKSEQIEQYLTEIATGVKLDIDDITYRLRRQWEYAEAEDYPHCIKSQKKLGELIFCFYLFLSETKRKKMPEIPLLPMPNFK